MFIWTFFDHKDLGNHLLQLCPKVVKHPVYLIDTSMVHTTIPCNFCKHVEKPKSWTVWKHYTHSHYNNYSYWLTNKGTMTSTLCTPRLPQYATLHGTNYSLVQSQRAPQQLHNRKSTNFNNFISLFNLPTSHIDWLPVTYLQFAYTVTHSICDFNQFHEILNEF